jgi:hypothetical protein
MLYFGAVYSERYLAEIAEHFNGYLDDSWVLVLHGPHKFLHVRTSDRIKTSNKLLNYDEVDLIINSATIGLALYDNSWPNTRYTAFSSEKIARYLHAGVPFIAFRNESYEKLKEEYNCCELLTDMKDLTTATENVMKDYSIYQANCYNAFERYYNIQHSIGPLIDFINAPETSMHLKETLNAS